MSVASVIIVGVGHNGLIAACYLAKAGFNVKILERRSLPGGMCVTEELIPGYQISSVASWYGMLRSSIIDDLDLNDSFKTYLPRTDEITFFDDNTYFLPTLGFPIPLRRQNLVRKAGVCELFALICLYRELSQAAKLLGPFLESSPVSKDVLQQSFKRAGLNNIADSLFHRSWFDLIDERFRSEKIKAMLCSYTFGSPFESGSIIGPLYALNSVTNNSRGSWGFIEGGMGRITEVISAKVKALGVDLRLGTPVKRISVIENRACGVELESGEILEAEYIVSNADPFTTFVKLMPEAGEVASRIRSLKRNYVGAKLHLALSALPKLSCDIESSIRHRLGGVVIVPSVKEIRAAVKAASEGRIPEKNIITLYFPSVYDRGVAPETKHLLSLDTHFNPALVAGRTWSEQEEKIYLKQVLAQLEQHMPDISSMIEAHVVISPGRLEEEYGCYCGTAWHIDMTPQQAFDERPLSGWANYETPVENLFLCGAGVHPGGAVAGIAGRNCAEALISSFNERSR